MIRRIIIILGLLVAFAPTAGHAQDKIKALIVDGQNNHGIWPKTTVMMKQYLEETGMFTVDVATTAKKGTDKNYKPEFSKYQVVVSNYNGSAWPEETQKSFVEYIKGGGGFVVVHAANNAFGNWKEYNEIIGLGGWGGRNEKSGPYVYFGDDGKLVRNTEKGRGGHHGPQHPFTIIVRDAEHPITKGMPGSWLHSKDELYDYLRGPATNMSVLATAMAAKNKGGSGRHEPMLLTIDYGKGRIFHTPMGHMDYSQECVGFITSLCRGTEWAATGKVTQEIPKDFPTADKESARKFVEKKADEAKEVSAEKLWVEYPGKGDGLGKGKHVVLISGDDEYRSEEAMPQLGKILSQRHGFKCTVLFPIDEKTGQIKPDHQTNIPGLKALETADAVVMGLRFRDLPNDQMKYIDDYVNSGKPIVGVRTSTHAFHMRKYKSGPYEKYGFASKEWKGGFGRQVLGETWINHHGHHGKQSTAGVINEEKKSHPILRGVSNIWGPTDVYGIRNLVDAEILAYGAVLEGMTPESKPIEGGKNEPMMPLAWTKSYKGTSGKTSRIMCTTMGSSTDFENEGLRRLVINSVLWGMGMEDKIPEKTNVDIVGEFKATRFGFGSFTKGLKPKDFELK